MTTTRLRPSNRYCRAALDGFKEDSGETPQAPPNGVPSSVPPQSEAVIWNIALATSLPQETTAISLILTDHDTEPNEEENQEKEEEEEMVGDSDSDSLDDHDEVIPPPPGLMYYPVSEAGGLNLPEVHLID